MWILRLIIGLHIGFWLASKTPYIEIEPPAWLTRFLCSCFGHNWSRASWHAYPDPVYLSHYWICHRCGEQRKELTRMTSDDLSGLTYEEWQALEKQRPASR